MKKHLVCTLLAAGCLLLSLVGCDRGQQVEHQCTDPIGCITIAASEPIIIGVLQALSGDVAPLGQAQVRGLELALDRREGKILGHPVSLRVEDTGCTAEGGANAALKVIADPDTAAIFGTTCSGAAATASRAMSEAGLTMISGNNSAPFLTSIAGKAAPDWQLGYFRTAPNEENAGSAAAGYAVEQGLRRAATINDNDIYTRGLTESFTKAFEELGGEVVLDAAVNKGETQMLPVLTAVLKAKPDVLFFPLFQPEGNHILLQARDLPDFAGILLISDGALIEQTFIDAVGEASRGMCFVGPERPAGPEVDKLTLAYEQKYNEEPKVNYFLSGYDAADLLFHAIEDAVDVDGNGNLHLGRGKLRETLYAIRGYPGVTGSLSCDRFGDCARSSFHVLRMDDPALGLRGLEENIVFTSGSGEKN